MPINVSFPYGIWESTEPEHRWKLGLAGTLCAWEERRAGSTNRTVSPLVKVPGTVQWRTERANTRDVLIFLGAQPSVADEIVAQTPPASFLLVQLQGDSVASSWNGLTWSLTPTGHLKEFHIAQPKPYLLRNTFQGAWNGRMWIGPKSFDISILIYFKGGKLEGTFLVPPDNQGPCDGLTTIGSNISFSVGAGNQKMDFTGSATAGFSNLSGTFQSQFGNGEWEVGWVRVETGAELHVESPQFAPSALFS